MSERFTVRIARLISAALGPNPLEAICPDMPEHDIASRSRVIQLIRESRPRLSKLSAA